MIMIKNQYASIPAVFTHLLKAHLACMISTADAPKVERRRA